jgi:hypothetical protein
MPIQSQPVVFLMPGSRLILTHTFHRTRHYLSQRIAEAGDHCSLGILGPKRLNHTPY